MTNDHSDKFFWYLLITFIAVMSIVYTDSVTDGDFYWHANTGKWILENMRLPYFDPFTYTLGHIDPSTEQGKGVFAILKGYWLGQIMLYLVWKMASESGIILLRAGIYTFILAFNAKWAIRKSNSFTAIILTALQGGALCFFPNERPQLFAFLLFPVLLHILERLREEVTVPACALMLPIVTILWGNIHGSYLLAAGIILIYLVMEIIRGIRIKQSPTKVAILTTSFFAAFASPVSFSMIWMVLNPHNIGILEAMSPVRIFINQHNPLLPYWGFVILSIITLTTASFRKTVIPEHLIVLATLIALTFTGSRYIGFAVLASPLLARYFPTDIKMPVKLASAALAVFLAVPAALTIKPLDFRESQLFPKGAASFINTTSPEKNLFNFYDWGGYLAFYAPKYKVFIDGRMLDPKLKQAYDSLIADPRSLALLDGYGVNTVIIPVFDSLGNRLKLPYKLLKSADWFPVYSDDTAVVFLRNTPINQPIIRRFALPKDVTISQL
jgi:hypothetical protein